MLIQPVNNKFDKTTFGAKYSIGGFTKDIPSELMNTWTKKLAELGNDSDGVIIHIGPREKTEIIDFGFCGLFSRKKERITRAIYGVADINGKEYDRNLSYHYKKPKFDEIKYIKKTIDKYIEELSALAKK